MVGGRAMTGGRNRGEQGVGGGGGVRLEIRRQGVEG